MVIHHISSHTRLATTILFCPVMLQHATISHRHHHATSSPLRHTVATMPSSPSSSCHTVTHHHATSSPPCHHHYHHHQVGIIVCAGLMCLASVEVLRQSGEALAQGFHVFSGSGGDDGGNGGGSGGSGGVGSGDGGSGGGSGSRVTLSLGVACVVVGAVLVKGALWKMCGVVAASTGSSSVAALAQVTVC